MSASLPFPSREWAYFLDMDGTLVELADTPEAIEVDESLVRLLARIHSRCGGAVAVVSGRMLADVDRRLGIPRLAIAGQHGLERRDSSGAIHRHPARSFGDLARQLAQLQERHPGLFIEDKGATLAIHYRLAPRLGGYLHRLLRRMVLEAQGLQLQPGKRVLEIKPAGIDKGGAILAFMSEPPFCGRRPVFIGDDLTDEHGFEVVNRSDGLSVKVGRGPTAARYRLADVASVRGWLATGLEEAL
ncbi:MAG: trehalose-phosphatase [Zoogloea sp.]|nr:trehalose-phosphatase [Zoogloea sp.]